MCSQYVILDFDTATLMQVACRPSLSSLTIDAFPANLKPYVPLGNSLAPADWQGICEAMHQEAESRYTACTAPGLN